MIHSQKSSSGFYVYYANMVQDIITDCNDDMNVEEFYDKLKDVLKKMNNFIYGD